MQQTATARYQRKWVSVKFVAEYYGVNVSTIWRWVKSGKVEAPIKVGPNTTRFDFDKIQAGEE